MIGYIYKTTNLENGKVYIGKHLATKHEPSYLGSGEILLKAIKLYGKENFYNEILDTSESVEELDRLEKFYIKQYHKQHKYMEGLIFGYGTFQRKSVTTSCDECSSVGVEIGTASKCETACDAEDIV